MCIQLSTSSEDDETRALPFDSRFERVGDVFLADGQFFALYFRVAFLKLLYYALSISVSTRKPSERREFSLRALFGAYLTLYVLVPVKTLDHTCIPLLFSS